MAIDNLIQHLQTPPQNEWLAQLNQQMGSLPHRQGPFDYFIVSHSNLEGILKTGRLLPRAEVAEEQRRGDLSASFVQTRRMEVYLGDGNRALPSKGVHDCLNFYWNPLNSTLDAMCRNALILNEGNMLIAIVQFPLEGIRDHIRDTFHLWACSNRNIAAGGFTTSLKRVFGADDWPWEGILSHQRSTGPNDVRSAEFLLWIESGRNQTGSDGLPIDIASRVFVPDIQGFAGRFPKFPADVVLWTPPKRRREYLQAERSIGSYFSIYEIDRGEALDEFQETTGKLEIVLGVDTFQSTEVAMSSLHGIPHVTRVMFWAYLLAQLCRREMIPDSPEDLGEEALIAAWLHDLCRESDSQDDNHGREAVEHYLDELPVFLGGDERRVNRVQEAIEYHCVPDDQAPNRTNPVFMVLKDADALDRGRFSSPCHGVDFAGTQCDYSKCHHSGCAYKTLRLPYNTVSQRFAKDVAWAAYWLARATYTSPWPDNDAIAFFLTFSRSGLILAGEDADVATEVQGPEENDIPF